ncbi:MAG: DUF1800 domain-containing protein [Pseudomonadota bacterium]
MAFDPVLADTRFGYGVAKGIEPPASVSAMIVDLQGEDIMKRRFQVEPFPDFFRRLGARSRLKKRMQGLAGAEAAEIKRRIKQINRSAREDYRRWFGAHILRRVNSATAFRERLEGFWANHFTAMGKSVPIRYGAPPYIESAIRPNLTGSFRDLLVAAVTHPLMLHYLDQKRAVGTASRVGIETGRGLNENLAREVLELHTLGTQGPYTQEDVRNLAELFTGLSSDPSKGQIYRSDQAEPGPKHILGEDYHPSMEDVRRLLGVLASHPSTARRICTKLARHFVSDVPPADLIEVMTQAFLSSDGALVQVYEAMLEHDAAWQETPRKMRSPFDFMASACRSLQVERESVTRMGYAEIEHVFLEPMKRMGQDWLRPKGPDGFPDISAAWATPHGMAARLDWALTAPQGLRPDLPDPRGLPARDVDEAVQCALAAAETRAQAVAVFLLSPAFQRV